jgi:hypothetical protein
VNTCKNIDTTIKNVTEIDKTFKPIWEFTYKISGGEERIRVVKRDPDNLLVSWISSACMLPLLHSMYQK